LLIRYIGSATDHRPIV